MPDDSYSIKEMITEFRGDMEKSFNSVYSRLDKIDNKQSVANGRVSKLEWWRGGIVWFIGILVMLAPFIFSLIQSEIKTAVVGVLADYNITVQK